MKMLLQRWPARICAAYLLAAAIPMAACLAASKVAPASARWTDPLTAFAASRPGR